MTVVKTEFALALNQVATERGIPVEEVLKSIEVAVLAAYKKEYPKEDASKLKALINPQTGEVKILKEKRRHPPGFWSNCCSTAKQS